MPDTAVNRRRGTTAQHAAFTGLVGETTYDTDIKRLVAHDGALAGGFPAAHLHVAQTFALSQTFAATENFFGSTANPNNRIAFLNPPGAGFNTLDFNTNATPDLNFLRKYATTPFQIELGGSGGIDLVTDTNNNETSADIRFLTDGIRGSGTQVLLATMRDNATLDLTGRLFLPNKTTTLLGGIYFGGNLAIHNFGTNNFFAGINSGNLTMTGSFNVGIGTTTLPANTIGSSNFAGGFRVLANNTSGDENVATGTDSMFTNTSGLDNSAYGVGSLYFNNGSQNGAFGYHTGVNLTTGNHNLIIGYNIDAPTPTSNNTLTIGNLIFGTGVDGVDLGISTGNIGIGVINPTAKLEVAGGLTLAATGVFQWLTRAAITSPADGIIRLTNNAQTDFTRLQFGGTTAAFPAIGRSGTQLEILGADGAGPSGLWIYNTKTSATNFERLDIQWTANEAQIFTEKGSGGGVARPLAFGTDGIARLTVGSSGIITWGGGTSSLEIDGSINIDSGNLFSANVPAGLVRLASGTVQANFTELGFFSIGPVTQQDVIPLGNNATGGTADTVDTIAGALYATDAPVIEGNFNQLALKVNQIITALENYGLLAP